MKVKFLSKLVLEVAGHNLYFLKEDFIFRISLSNNKYEIFENDIVPKGFVTDLASVPRLPFAYWFAGGYGHEAAVIHDYLYAQPNVSKQFADDVFLEALKTMGVGWFRRNAMYQAVKWFGDKD